MSNQQSKEMATFNFHNQPVRVVTLNDEPWFVAKDICDVLNIKNTTQAIQSLDNDERSMFNIGRSKLNGGGGEINIINESGMYAIVLRTRKAMKKGTSEHSFRKWVTSEVLPSIRKTGSYNAAPTPMSVSNADWIRYLQALTIPEMVQLTGHDQKSVISGLYQATHSRDEHVHQQPSLPNLPPQVQTALDQFWDTVSQLDLQQINHSRDPEVLAISLPELYTRAGEQLPQRRSMLSALKHSLIPQFKDSNHAINSTITGNTKKCWVFVMPTDQESQLEK